MINIKTQTDYWLDTEDSKLYIQFELRSKFSTYAKFHNELWMFENPLYSGDLETELQSLQKKYENTRKIYSGNNIISIKKGRISPPRDVSINETSDLFSIPLGTIN